MRTLRPNSLYQLIILPPMNPALSPSHHYAYTLYHQKRKLFSSGHFKSTLSVLCIKDIMRWDSFDSKIKTSLKFINLRYILESHCNTAGGHEIQACLILSTKNNKIMLSWLHRVNISLNLFRLLPQKKESSVHLNSKISNLYPI